MLIVTDRNLQTLTIVSNDYPDGVHFQDDKFNENLETGTCMLTCSIDKVVEKDVELIEAGCLVVATGYKKKPVLLEITEVVETRYSKEIVAEDCGLDLLNEDIAEQDFKGTLVEWVNNTLGDKSDWVVGINEAKDKNLAFKFDGTTTKTKRLAMIAGRFGCEISYDVKLNGNAIDKKVINFYKKRGKETGYRLEFGRDLSDVKRTVSIADLCTAVRAVGKPHKEQIREVKQVEIEEDKKKPAPNSKIELFVKWMKSREGKVRYSQARREGPNYYDCSSSVSSAAKFAGLFPKSVGLPTTGTLWAWGNAGTYFHQINQSEIQYGDIFVSRYNNKGHTGVILDKNTIIHCTLYGSINGIVTTKLSGWTGPNVRFYRWNENKGGTIVDATKKTYWTNSDVTKHDLGKRLQGITATQINNWIRAKAPNSPFNGQGQVFIEAQSQSGLDARYILAHAALESAWGTSRIAREYHNYFGINAYDSNPDNAKKSSNRSLQAGIINGAVWIKEHYYNRGQKTLYAMNHDRNGHNYASDKAWGDKIANIMKGSERFTNPGATASSTEQVSYKEHEVNTDLVGYKYDDGRFYVTDDGLICDRRAAKKWTRFNKTGQKYFIRMYESEATSQKTLFDEGLRFLKNNNEAKISYEVSLRQLPGELEIGDYIRIIDHGFKPALYLSARLVDITRSLCDELSNSAIFANFEEEKAGISERLLSLEKSVYSSRFNWQNVPYEMQLSSSQGNVFKDGVLSTEITAIVTKAGVDQTAMIDKFVWERVSEYQDKITKSDDDWNKSKEGSTGNILGINNTDVDLQATFTCSAMLNDVAVATSFITIKDLTIGIYKQEKEPDRSSLSWGDVWQWDDGKGNHFKRLWKGDRWEDTITKRDLEILELTPGPPGADGENGMPGKDGKDGRTSYMHFAYADSADGTVGFTRTATSGKKYIGFYTDFEKTDSTDPKRYEWSKYVGEDGKNGKDGSDGIPGKAGADGKTPYLHIAYSNSQDGSKDFSTTDSKRDYIGTYTDFEKADSADYKKYLWSKIKGEFEGEIGGRNYLLKSGEKISNANYLIARYDLAEKPTVGETYTCTIWGNLAKEKSAFGIYNSSGSIVFGNLTNIKDGVYQKTFKWNNSAKLSDGSIFKVNDTQLWVYSLYMNVTGVTSSIDKIKLEKGSTGTDWTPAPEDFEDELEKKADSQTVTDIESRQQAVEVLISQKADKDSVTKSFVEIEKAKAYADTVKKALENESLSLQDRIKIIEENVGAGKLTIEAITTYFDFGEEGILIGKKDEAVKMILKNNALEIIDGTKTVARFANSQVQVPNLKVDGVLEFGYHMVTKHDNGVNKYTIIKPI